MSDFMRENDEEDQWQPATVPDLSIHLRSGGPQGDEDEEEEEDDEAARKAAERNRKKEEVRKRLEEASRAKKSKAKKGFLTPDRKKKLRKLLMMKAAEDLKQKQLQLEQERQRILQERMPNMPNLDRADEDELAKVAEDFIKRILILESEHYDINRKVQQKDFEINELTIAVNDLKGKFVKPTLKKVSKTGSKFDKLTKKKDATKVDFRNNLKVIDQKKFAMEDEKEKEKVVFK